MEQKPNSKIQAIASGGVHSGSVVDLLLPISGGSSINPPPVPPAPEQHRPVIDPGLIIIIRRIITINQRKLVSSRRKFAVSENELIIYHRARAEVARASEARRRDEEIPLFETC